MTSFRKLAKYYMKNALRNNSDAMRDESRKRWPPGQWDKECDDFYFTYRRVHCFGRRSVMGVWCGYVGVWRGHPWYEKGYDDVAIDGAHGGLTFAGRLHPGRGHPWCLGFDCGHCGDDSPGVQGLIGERDLSFMPDDSAYRTMPYVMGCLREMANEVRAAE